jgi:hypothetical protein
MTTVVISAYRPWSHRVALRIGSALTAWGARPIVHDGQHDARVALIEGSREAAARVLPQLPR